MTKKMDIKSIQDEMRRQHPVARFAQQNKDKNSERPKDERETFEDTGQPASLLASKLASKPASQEEIGPTIGQGRMFYITQKVDQWLDQAVFYLRSKKGIHKADRSTVVNAILHAPELYEPQSLDRLAEAVLRHIANKNR